MIGIRKRPSGSDLNSFVYRSCELRFKLPHGSRPGEDMPSTLSSLTGDLQDKSCMEDLAVAYRVAAAWKASDGSVNRGMYVDCSMEENM